MPKVIDIIAGCLGINPLHIKDFAGYFDNVKLAEMAYVYYLYKIHKGYKQICQIMNYKSKSKIYSIIRAIHYNNELHEKIKSIINVIEKGDEMCLTTKFLLNITAEIFDCKIDDMKSKSRKNNHFNARAAFGYVALYTLKLSKSEIGKFVNRDHSTMARAIEIAESYCLVDNNFLNKVVDITAKINEHLKSTIIKKILIIGKVDGLNYDEVKLKFLQAETWLRRLEPEIIIYNPVKIVDSEASHAEAMKITIPLLFECDAIYCLKDWENSPGARLEHEIAMHCNIKINYEKINYEL